MGRKKLKIKRTTDVVSDLINSRTDIKIKLPNKLQGFNIYISKNKTKTYKERHIYFGSKCSGCGGKFQSFKRSRIKTGLCKKCRRNKPVKGQTNLF